MSQVLNSLVISRGREALHTLEEIMQNNIAGHILSFSAHEIDGLDAVDREPDLIFIENHAGLGESDIAAVLSAFPYKTYVVLDDTPEETRAGFVAAGADEVMSLADLQSDIGKHLLQKLLAFKDLAAAERELTQHREHLQKLVEQRTKEAEAANQRADAVLTASPDALIALDENGCISFISRHYYTAYPLSAKMLARGVHILDAFKLVSHEIGLAETDPRYADMLEWWRKPKGAKEFKTDNGVWLRLQPRRIPETDGIVISTTNITNYKRQQALLAAQSEELAQALAKEKSVVEQQKTFISMVSHEFRTPLTIIDGNAQIIERRGDTIGKAMLDKRAGTIRAAVDRLVRLIETILSAHTLESGRLTPEPEPCDLSALIREVCAEQQDVSPEHGITLNLRGLPATMTLDKKMIRQALANLLSNAVKYSPEGKRVTVSGFCENGNLVIEVKDNGVGIPEKELPQIFDRYYRASTSAGVPGSGLGLSLVRQLVALHHGTVDLRSKVGIGTVIAVSLPLQGDTH
jgi:signal transduction histidine kinase